MYRLIHLILLVSLSQYSYSNQLTDKLNELSSTISEVNAGKNHYKQEIQFEEGTPFKVQLKVVEINQKGKETLFDYGINLALLDPHLIRWEDSKDRMMVNIKSAKDPLIKMYKNGGLVGYEKEVTILATDIDNARAIEAILKEVVPLSKEAWEKASAFPESYEELKSWVIENVKDFSTEGTTILQEWGYESEHPSRCHLYKDVSKSNKKVIQKYEWNLADVYLPSIKMEIKSKEVIVRMGINKQMKFIQVSEDNALKNYASDMSIHFNEVDDAQVMAYALQKLVPMAVKSQEGYYPEVKDHNEAVKWLEASLVNHRQDEDDLYPSLEGDCETQYDLIRESSKGKFHYTYLFNFADLLAGTAEIEVRGTNLEVKVTTSDNKKYIRSTLNHELQNYTNTISFPASDIPAAKQLKFYLEQAIYHCPDETPAVDLASLQNIITGIEFADENINQTLELIDNDPCKWIITINKQDVKKDRENKYEFNLYDIDHSRVDIVVKGKMAGVLLPTKGNDKIIKNYTDGEKLGYVDDFFFGVQDIPNAKVAQSTVRSLVDGCNAEL
jgi:hypothetical protein